MQWTKPDFQEISLNMEVTAYANTDDSLPTVEKPQRTEAPEQPREAPA
jgi:coenzyme PQQ precursor peptide PqqA